MPIGGSTTKGVSGKRGVFSLSSAWLRAGVLLAGVVCGHLEADVELHCCCQPLGCCDIVKNPGDQGDRS